MVNLDSLHCCLHISCDMSGKGVIKECLKRLLKINAIVINSVNGVCEKRTK